MIRGVFRWSGGIVAIALLLLIVSAAWLLATTSGARWLLQRASPYLPAALRIDEVQGNVLEGLAFRSVSWTDDAADVSVRDVDTQVELMPLLRREVRIRSLDVRNVDVTVKERPPDGGDEAAFVVDLPVRLRIDRASIENIRIAGAGSDFTIDSIRLSGELSGSALNIERFDLQSGMADIGLSGEAQLEGDYPVNASAAWEIRLPDQPTLSGVLRLQGDAFSYEIQHDLDAPYTMTTRGSVALADTGIVVDLENRWELVSITQGNVQPIELIDGVFRVTGTVGKLEFDGLTTVLSADVPAAAVQTRGRFDGERVSFESLSVSNDWGELLADGELLLTPELRWSFDVGISELDPSIADARLSGNLAITGTTSGRFAQERPSLELTIEQLSGKLNGYPVDGSGTLSFADERLRFDKTVVRVGDNRIEFDGVYGTELSVDAKARLPDLSQLGLGVSGALNSDFRFSSNFELFEASGFVGGENLAWQDNVVDSLRADFNVPATGKGTISLQAGAAEQGRVSAEVDGRFIDNQWSGALKELVLDREPIGEWRLRESAGLLLSRSEFTLETACLETSTTPGKICVAVDYGFGGALQFDASIVGLPVAALPRYLPEGATLRGEIAAEAHGGFADGQLNSNVSLQINGLGLIATFEGDEASAMFEKASLSATVVDNRLVGEFEVRLDNALDHAIGRIELEDIFDPQSALRGQGDLDLNDLSLFSFFVPDLANPQGKIFGNIEAAGNLLAPEITGEVGLRDGAVDIRRAGISVSEIGLLLRQSRAGELSLQGSAKSGEGYLQINGETSFGAESGVRSEIRLNGEDFRLIRLPDWQVAASPTITAVFDDRETRINGELGIPEASITVQTVPETTEKPSPDAVVHRGDAAVTLPRRILYVDVVTKLGKDVSFSGFGLTTKLEGSVRISGDSKSPYKGLGRLVLREGRYQAYGQNLDIESGELIFNGPLSNPALNVRATRTASDKTVAGIHLTGTPAQLRSEVYSEPTLGDAEALSYLLTGRPLNSANSAEGDMLNQAAFALGLTTAGSVTSRIRNELGLETLGFQGGAENRQLVAGKRLGDRLFIEYAYGVVDSLGTLLLRYQLSQRLMVESRSGSVRNVDLVYSVKKP